MSLADKKIICDVYKDSFKFNEDDVREHVRKLERVIALKCALKLDDYVDVCKCVDEVFGFEEEQK